MKPFASSTRILLQAFRRSVIPSLRTAVPVLLVSVTALAASLAIGISISLADLPGQGGNPTQATPAAIGSGPALGPITSGAPLAPAEWLGRSGELRAVIGTSSKLLAEASTLGLS